MKYIVFLSAIMGASLLYLLSSNSANTELLSPEYYGILALTALLALGLFVVIAFQIWQLRNKLKHRVFGARLTLRLVLFFVSIGVLPGVMVYAASVEFLGKSIESWFDVRVERALEGGLNLGKNMLNNSLDELNRKTEFVGLLLAEKQPEEFPAYLHRLVDEGSAQGAAVFSREGKLLAAAASTHAARPLPPEGYMLTETLQRGRHGLIDTVASQGLLLRSLARVDSHTRQGQQYILQFTQPVPQNVARDADTVKQVFSDYQTLVLSRVSLKRLYGITLTLSLLIVLLAAISVAFFISDRLGSSLEALAEGTRAVAQGDFSSQYPVLSSDELGSLTSLFNQMTRQLADAQTTSQLQQQQVENARGYLESVLTHLSSGVLALDEALLLRSVNHSAGQILSAPVADLLGLGLDDIASQYPLLTSFCDTIRSGFQKVDDGEWHKQIERLDKNGKQVLLMRGTRLPQTGAGYVVVFDDISYLLQAERQSAWGEVARRLAHEIKNPLTPIQLSAERLQYKLAPHLEDQQAQLLERATRTITNQVTALKNMVSDFANYARGPALKLEALDLHHLIQDVLDLYHGSKVQVALNAQRAVIMGDPTRLRQVVHNLLQNAQDALQDKADGQITLNTQLRNNRLRLSVIDNGSGFPDNVLARAFEPYMTTKSKGTGLGLAIVKKIVEEHSGHIRIENNAAGGASIIIEIPIVMEA